MQCEKHNLIPIYWTYERGGGEQDVIRWCEICGAIVIDTDVDNRCYPGAVMKMKFPKSAYETQPKI